MVMCGEITRAELDQSWTWRNIALTQSGGKPVQSVQWCVREGGRVSSADCLTLSASVSQ